MPNVSQFSFYLEAFRELSTCRPSGFGLSPIPFTAIVEYARIYGVDEFNEFLDLIRAMDSELLKLESNNSQGTSTKKKSNGKSGNSRN